MTTAANPRSSAPKPATPREGVSGEVLAPPGDVLELEGLALDVFASAEDAHGWLQKPHPVLGESPIDAASTSYGAQRVREILAAIKYGGVV